MQRSVLLCGRKYAYTGNARNYKTIPSIEVVTTFSEGNLLRRMRNAPSYVRQKIRAELVYQAEDFYEYHTYSVELWLFACGKEHLIYRDSTKHDENETSWHDAAYLEEAEFLESYVYE